LATQIGLLANLQVIDQSLRAKTLAVEEGQGRVAALEEAVQAQSAAAAAARGELGVVTARQQELETRLTANETKLKDRRMRLARIRSDKDLGVARREVDLLKEETGTIETELIGVLEQVEAGSAMLRGVEEELARLRAAMETEAAALRETVSRLSGEDGPQRAGRGPRRRAAPQVRDDLLAARRAGRGRDPRGHLPGLPHARPAPAHQRAPAQRTGDPLPELPAHAILAG